MSITPAITPFPTDAPDIIGAALVDAGLVSSNVGLKVTATPSVGRHPYATTYRGIVTMQDIPRWSFKAFPTGGLFDPTIIATAQQHLAGLPGIRVPAVLATRNAGGWDFLIETFVAEALDLATLVTEGVISADEARGVQGRILEAIHAQQPSQPERNEAEYQQLQTAISEAPLPEEQRLRLAAWVTANYLLISYPPVWTTRDVTPANILRAPTGPQGQDEWWLVDFDLACQTSLPWFDVLRAGRMSPWGLATWNQAWGAPTSLALVLLTRILELDLQKRVVLNPHFYHEHPVMLQVAADAWDRVLGRDTSATSATEPPHGAVTNPARDMAQIFWDGGQGFSESDSISIPWPVGEDLVEHRFTFPKPVTLSALRFDFANGPCAFLWMGLRLQANEGYRDLSLANVATGGDALSHPLGMGLVAASLGHDPQLLVHLEQPQVSTSSVSLIGCKYRGLDPWNASQLMTTYPGAADGLKALVIEERTSLRATLALQRVQQARMEHQRETDQREYEEDLEHLRQEARAQEKRLRTAEVTILAERHTTQEERAALIAMITQRDQQISKLLLQSTHDLQTDLARWQTLQDHARGQRLIRIAARLIPGLRPLLNPFSSQPPGPSA